MRILTVANQLGSWGGLERSQLATCRALAERGHAVDLVYSGSGNLIQEWRAFADSMTQVDRTLPHTRAPLTSSFRVLGSAREVRDRRPDVVFVYRYLDLPFASAVSRLTRAPIVLRLGLPPPPRLPFVVRRSLPNVAMTLAVSFDSAHRWLRTPLPADSVVVVHTGIDMDRYRPEPERQQRAVRQALGIDEGAFVVLYAGRLTPEKGLDSLMEAARLLHGRLPRFQLVVAGGPPYGTDPSEAARYLTELQARAGPMDIRWLGHRDDVVRLLCAADAAVVPSAWDEPFSRSIIEPLACGTPVIATEVGGASEILVGWLRRFLVPGKDPVALANALACLEGWRVREPDLGGRCRAAVVDRLSLDRAADTTEAALASVARHRAVDPFETYR